MTSINLNQQERKDLIRQMKRETRPCRRLRMHIVLLVADDKLKPAQIAAVLYCSRTTVYAVAHRFSQQKGKAFDDKTPRGPVLLWMHPPVSVWNTWWSRKHHGSMAITVPDGLAQFWQHSCSRNRE